MGNTKIIPCGFGPVLVLVLLAGVVGGLGQWWADGGSQAVQLARCGALLAEAWGGGGGGRGAFPRRVVVGMPVLGASPE